MTQADTEVGTTELGDPRADGRLLGDQPRMFVLFPDIHRSPHDEEEVEGLKVGNRPLLRRARRGQTHPGVDEQGPQRTRIFCCEMLQHQDFAPRLLDGVCSIVDPIREVWRDLVLDATPSSCSTAAGVDLLARRGLDAP